MPRQGVLEFQTLILFCLVNLRGIATGGFQYQGCYGDNSTKALDTFIPGGKVSTYTCFLICGGNGFGYFGLENGGECYCGEDTYIQYSKVSRCNMTCRSGEICGGQLALSVYAVTDTPPIAYYWSIGSNYLINSIGTASNIITCTSTCQLGLDRFGSTGAINLYTTPGSINDGFTLEASSTITLWFQRHSLTPYAPIIDCYDSNADTYFTIFIANDTYGSPWISIDSSWKFITNYSLVNETWYHLAISFTDESKMLLYINGQYIDYRGAFSYAPFDFQQCSLGRMINGSYPADISLDDLKIFNRTLSQQEIAYEMSPIVNVSQSESPASSKVGIGLIVQANGSLILLLAFTQLICLVV